MRFKDRVTVKLVGQMANQSSGLYEIRRLPQHAGRLAFTVKRPASHLAPVHVGSMFYLSDCTSLPVSASLSFRWRVGYKPALVLLEALFSFFYGNTVKRGRYKVTSVLGVCWFFFFFGGVCENKLEKKKEADVAWQRFRFVSNQS